MFDYVTNAIVRILDAEQKPSGAGCLVRERLVATCAHVVADALGIAREAKEAPHEPLNLDFPFVPDAASKARVVLWWPYRQAIGGDRRHDLALLELTDALQSAEPARLLRPGHEQRGPIHVYGFPRNAGLEDLGDWIEGRLTPPVPNGWLKLVQREQQARFIEPGCSGGPVIVDETGLVAGIVSLRRSGSGSPEAYGISAALIREALNESVTPATAVSDDVPREELAEEARPFTPEPTAEPATIAEAPARQPDAGAGKRSPQPRIFLAHASEDKPQVRQLYGVLKARGFEPWLDEVDLIPGQVWRVEIPKAIREAGLFLACLSSRSAAKQGYVQSEFRTALMTFAERQPGSIWLIPVKLDDCEIPDLQIPDRGMSLRDIHWLDLSQERGFERLVQAIEFALPKAASSSSINLPLKGGGRGQKAGVIDVASLPDQERVLGPDHPDTLRARYENALRTGETGDAREALRLSAALLPDLEGVLGPDHLDTLRARYENARWTGETGDAREALRLSAALLPDLERVLGPDHPSTLSVRSNIAGWTGETGSALGALRLFEALLLDQERILGPNHPDTLITRSNIARWARERRDVTGSNALTRWFRRISRRQGLVMALVALVAGIAGTVIFWWPGSSLEPGDVFGDCEECPLMVVVPPGSFLMGSPQDEEGRDSDEGPQREVTIAEPFAIGRYEVTFDEWDACVTGGGCNGHQPKDEGWGRGRRPVINVSWDDAQAYVAWLRGKTGEDYRLPSEAEWEYAARAGTTTRYSWGDAITPEDANYGVNVGQTTEVGAYPANPLGLHDMHGNVWEWVEDCRNDSYQGAPDDGSAWRTGTCSLRVVRGGSWNVYPRHLRSADRSWGNSGNRFDGIGFRVARTVVTP